MKFDEFANRVLSNKPQEGGTEIDEEILTELLAIHAELLALWKSLNETRQWLIETRKILIDHLNEKKAL